ncbi:MAG: hypothetical protein M3515_09930 [Actinomycetota bacterium]|jgi:hypothetical protein|nr:hypothetical protein [Actinomycetota bacterium]
MSDNEETPETIPSLEDTDEELTDEQQERAATQPGAGDPTEKISPEGDNPNPAESTEKIGNQDQVEGQTGA